jgi:uncharacterized protein YodC (DUF2158 family)
MAEKKWKTGDVVMLKSGGPRMTVRGYDEDREIDGEIHKEVICQWIDGKKPQVERYLEAQLMAPPPPVQPRVAQMGGGTPPSRRF